MLWLLCLFLSVNSVMHEDELWFENCCLHNLVLRLQEKHHLLKSFSAFTIRYCNTLIVEHEQTGHESATVKLWGPCVSHPFVIHLCFLSGNFSF